MTLPSMASFFTSKYPHQHGVLDNKKQIPPAEWTLAERLQSAGFHTRAFNASGVLQPGRGNIEQGFDKYDKIFDERAMTAKTVHFVENFFGKDGRREFLWVHFMNPHKPYLPPPSLLETVHRSRVRRRHQRQGGPARSDLRGEAPARRRRPPPDDGESTTPPSRSSTIA